MRKNAIESIVFLLKACILLIHKNVHVFSRNSIDSIEFFLSVSQLQKVIRFKVCRFNLSKNQRKCTKRFSASLYIKGQEKENSCRQSHFRLCCIRGTWHFTQEKNKYKWKETLKKIVVSVSDLRYLRACMLRIIGGHVATRVQDLYFEIFSH